MDPDKIYPFNMEPADASAMFRTSLIGIYPMKCSIRFTEVRANLSLSELFGTIAYSVNPKAVHVISDSADWSRAQKVTYLSANFRKLLTPKQHKWRSGGYVQTAYFDPSAVEYSAPLDGIALAMLIYDYFVDTTGSLDPQFHQPFVPQSPTVFGLRLPPRWIVDTYRAAVGDIFRIKLGVWSQRLVDDRNENQIWMRALALGRDPNVEWAKFQAAGYQYFLKYPW